MAEKPLSVMIATPMYGGMCAGYFVLGLLSTINTLGSVGISVDFATITNESLITRARNELVRRFLETEHDYLMFIDADIAFDEQAVANLLAADRDIACGIYPRKEIDWKRVKDAALSGKENVRDYAGVFVLALPHHVDELQPDADGMVELRHGGTGFMLIKRRVFETLLPHVPAYRTSTTQTPDGRYLHPLTREFFATSIDDTGCLLSEDYHFCELWKNHGGKIYANPFVKLEHIGTHVYSGDIMEAGANLK